MNEQNFKKQKDYLKNTQNITNVAQGVAFWRKYLISRIQETHIFFNTEQKSFDSFQYRLTKLLKGYTVVFEKNGKLWSPIESTAYGFDAYNVPNRVVYGNPVLGSGTLTPGKDCVLCWNTEIDKIAPGTSVIMQNINRTARLLAEVESTFANSLIFGRSGLVAETQNKTTAIAYNELIEKIKLGETTSVINPTMQFDTLRTLNLNPNINFSTFCEAKDYIINGFFNSIGLATLEEKKERMVSDELTADDDILTNNSDILYHMECRDIDAINKMFGTNIVVKKNKILL